jgi:MFS family permease
LFQPVSPEERSRFRHPLLPLLVVNFIGTLGFSIVLPFLVFLVTKWGGNAVVYGIVGATYSAFQLVGAPVLGRWSDTRGRRRILLLSQLGTLLSWLLFLTAFFLPQGTLLHLDLPLLGTFSLTLPLLVLLVARAADGLTGGNVSVANAYLADVTPEDKRSENFGKMAVSSNLGFILGPALAGLLGGSAWGELLPVLAAVAISLAGTLLIALTLPESNPCAVQADPEGLSFRKLLGQEPRPCFEGQPAERPSLPFILRLPGVPLLLAIHFLVMLAFNFFYVSFPVHAVRELSWTVRETGAFFSVLSLLMVIVQGPVLARLAPKTKERTLVIFGSLALSVSFLFYVAGSDASVYSGAALLALGNGLMWPSLISILSKRAGQHQGVVQGIAGSGGAVASIIGLVLGGVLYGHFAGLVFFISAGLLMLVTLASLRLPRLARA